MIKLSHLFTDTRHNNEDWTITKDALKNSIDTLLENNNNNNNNNNNEDILLLMKGLLDDIQINTSMKDYVEGGDKWQQTENGLSLKKKFL